MRPRSMLCSPQLWFSHCSTSKTTVRGTSAVNCQKPKYASNAHPHIQYQTQVPQELCPCLRRRFVDEEWAFLPLARAPVRHPERMDGNAFFQANFLVCRVTISALS